jgi:hypothetical protein
MKLDDTLNIFLLHTDEDKELKNLIRILPNNEFIKNFQNIINRKDISKLNSFILLKLKEQNITVDKNTVYGWLKLYYPMPLIALKIILDKFKQNYENWLPLCDLLSTNRKKNKIPKLSTDLLYYYGLILGDGSLPVIKGKYPIVFTEGDKQVVEIFKALSEKIFLEKPKIEKTQGYYTCRFKSKIVYRIFTNLLCMKSGKKAREVRIPEFALGNDNMLLPIIAGFSDTDGGKYGNSFGWHIASKTMIDQLAYIFQNNKITFKLREYQDKKERRYYAIYIEKKSIKEFNRLVLNFMRNNLKKEVLVKLENK